MISAMVMIVNLGNVGMFTKQLPSSDNVVLIAHSSEKAPSPKDVKRRMLQVQSSWDATERVERRLRTLSRLQSLMEILEREQSER